MYRRAVFNQIYIRLQEIFLSFTPALRTKGGGKKNFLCRYHCHHHTTYLSSGLSTSILEYLEFYNRILRVLPVCQSGGGECKTAINNDCLGQRLLDVFRTTRGAEGDGPGLI